MPGRGLKLEPALLKTSIVVEADGCAFDSGIEMVRLIVAPRSAHVVQIDLGSKVGRVVLTLSSVGVALSNLAPKSARWTLALINLWRR